MPLRLIPTIFIVAVAIWVSLRNSRHGVFLLVISVFLNPGSFFWLIDSFHIPLLLGVVTGIATVREGKLFRDRLPLPSQNWMFTLMIVFLSISALEGSVHDRTYPMLENWVKLFILFSLVLRVLRDEEQVHRMWILILGAIGLLSLRGIYHFLVGYDEITGLPHSTMADRNDFAMVLSMTLPFAFYFFRTGKGLLRIAFFLLHGLILLVILITYSRMGFLLVFAYLIILFFQSRRKYAYLAVTVPLVFLAVSFAPESLVERVKTIRDYEADQSSMGRIRAWKAGIRMMQENPITGVGLNSFEIPEIYSRYADDIPHVAHNAYIQLGAEAGIPALVLYMLMIITTGGKLWQYRRESGDDSQKMFYSAMLVSLFLYCGGSIFLSAEDRESLYILIASVCVIDLVRRGKKLEPGGSVKTE